MNMHMAGQYIPGDSLVHKMDGRAKFFSFLMLTAAVILADFPWGYILMAMVAIITGRFSGLSFFDLTETVRRMGIFFLIVFCMNAFFISSSDPIWTWLVFALSKEGMIRGVSVVLRIVLILLLSNILTTATPPIEIMTGIELFLRPLKLLRIPSEQIAMILSVAMQFIPVLLEEADTIKKAQIARGAQFESRSIRKRAMALFPLIIPVFIAAFRRADELAMAMESRGYRHDGKRTGKEKKPMDRCSWMGMAFCAALIAAEIILF